MSNQKCYSIDRCSIGESFDFSRAGSNDVSSNSITNSIVPCSVLSITIIISPQDQTVVAGGKIQFSAIVVNANDQKVKWSCSIGSIDDTGMFTAPYYAGAVSITAESFSYPRVTSTAAASVVIPDIDGNIGVQARGGSWVLAGIPAWDGSNRRFGSNTWSGAHTISDATVPCSSTATYSGVGTYDPSTGATASSLKRTLTQGAGNCVTGEAEVGYGYNSSPSDVLVMWATCTSTATVQTCVPDAPFAPAVANGTVTATLSAEDLPPAAIGRMLATAEWGSATTAIRTIPTTSITGLYRQMRYGTYVEQTINGVTTWVYAPLTGLIYTQTYHIVVLLQRRPVDSSGAPTGDGSWSDAGTGYSESFQPDVNGTGGVEWQIVEPEEGYETRIASWTAELI